MKKNVLSFILVFALVGTFLLPFGTHSANAQQESILDSAVVEHCNSNNLVPVIIELTNPCLVEVSSTQFFAQSFYRKSSDVVLDYSLEGSILKQQNDFLNNLNKDGISFEYNNENCSVITNSVAIDIKGTHIDKLNSYKEIKQVWLNENIYFPTRYTGAQTTHAVEAWEGVGKNLGVDGKGIKVGIIDSGLDTTHEDFQKRVRGGYDFADGDKDWHDDLPVSMHGSGHGTHVAGIVGGRSERDKFAIGMAPESILYIYKVFSSSHAGANPQNIAMAVERSIKDKCDVINMSLGHESGDPATVTGYYGAAIRNADKAGVMVVVAAGNDGTRGKKQKYAIGSPGSIDTCFCVAATDDRSQFAFTAEVNGEIRRMSGKLANYSPVFSPQLSGSPIVDCGYGSEDDIKVPLDGTIALIQRGPRGANPLTFREKMDNARDAGALGVIIYNYEGGELVQPGLFAEGEDPSTVQLIPTCLITNINGVWIRENIDSVNVDFQEGIGSIIATFSSQGSGSDGWFKPEIATPGTDILSTYPRNSYAKNSGTSMASPLMAGLVALLKEAKPKWNHDQIKSAFMNTADILMNEINNLPITFTLQGAGQARIDKAIETPAFIKPPALVIKRNEILPYQSDADKPIMLEIENALQQSQTLSVSSTVYLLEGEENPVNVLFKQEQICVDANQKKKIAVSFEIDRSIMIRGRYEGCIMVGELHVPFIVYRDSPNSDVQAISDVVIEPKELIFTEDESTDNIIIQFSMNSGTEQNWSGFAGGSSYSNYGTISIGIFDEYGEEWAQIASLSSLLIGDYQLDWNGRDKNDKYILPQGKYHVEFQVSNWKYTQSGLDYYKDTYTSNEKMKVVDSVVPEPGMLIVSTNRLLDPDEQFYVDLILEEAIDVIGVEFEFVYNGNKLMCDGAYDGGFLGLDGADVEIIEEINDSDDKNANGYVTLYRYANADQPEGISGEHVTMARILFDPNDDGRMKVSLKNCKLVYADGSEARLRYKGGSFTIEKDDDFLLCDINNDDVVDKYDLRILKDHYLSSYGDERYDDDCDFNQDYRIDIDDLQIFGKEYKRMI